MTEETPMRIENAINEIRGAEKPERRNAEVKRRQGPGRAKDVVEISKAARSLEAKSVNRADLAKVSDVRQARVEAARQRVASGYYDRPEVRAAIADAVLDSGVVDAVGEEVQQAREARQQMDVIPDVREDRVAQARQRVAAGFYDSAGAQAQTADRVLDALIG